MRPAKLCSKAESDYEAALMWYMSRSVRAADDFDEAFAAAMQTIERDPDRGPYCSESDQFLNLVRFPYRVVYRQQVDRILVLSVPHHSQDR